MANLAKIQSIAQGQFFVKDSLGNLTELKVGDTVSLNDTIVAASSNTDLSKIEILFDTNELITLSQGEQLLDTTLLASTFGNEELAFDKQEVDETLNAWNNAQDGDETDMETAAGDVTEQATNAGDENAQDGGALRSKFNSRDGSSTNVESDLRDTSFGGGNTEEPQEQIPTELLNPVDTRVPASVITLSDPIVKEGNQITITATVTNPPQTDLIITLNNGQTITIPAGQTTGSVKFDNPNGEDVYKDGETLNYTITGTTGGNYVSLDTSDSSIVTIADTTNNTNATLTSEIVGNEDGAVVTYTITLDTAPTQKETFTFKVGDVTKTIEVEAGKTTGKTTVEFKESDVFKDIDTIPQATDLQVVDTDTNADGLSNYEQLTLVNNTTSHDVADTTNNTNATLTSEIVGNEDGAVVTYTITLDTAPTQKETFTFKVGDVTKTIEVEAGKTTGKTTVEFKESDVFKDIDTIPQATDLQVVDTDTNADGLSNYEQLTLVNNTTSHDVADSIDTTTVTITAAKVTDKVITKDNFENNQGFTVKAKDPYGNDAKISTHTGPAGFGVESLAETNSGKLGQTDKIYSGHTSEIGVVKEGSTYKSESIEVEFKNLVHTLDVAFAWRHNGETAKVDFYNGNEKVGYAIVKGGGNDTLATIEYYDKNGNLKETVNAQGGTDNVDLVYTFKPAGDVSFTKAVFSAEANDKDFGQQSDYLIHSISYKEVSDGTNTTIVGSDEVAFKIATSNIPDPSKYDFKTTFPTADVKIVDKNTGEVLFNGTVNLDKDGKAIVTVRTDGTKDLIAEVSNVQGNFEEVDYTNAKTEVEASIKATASNDSFNTLEDTNYVLKTTDFGDKNQNVAKIKFDSVPVNGTIYVLKSEYTGSMNDRAEYTSSENKVYIEVKAGDIVDISKIENGNVVFVPNKDTDADSSFNFSVSNGNGVFTGSYETKVNVIAVADKPDVEISITKIGATTIVGDGNGNESNSSGIKALDILKVNPNYNGQETIGNDYSYSGNDDITKNYQNVNATNITTDKGNDTLEFQSLDSKNINSGAGNDTVIVNQGASSSNIQLGEGNNSYTVAGSLNSGTTQSGAGNDTLIVNQGASNTVINLGDGNNKISIGEALNNSNISTGNGNDTLIVGQASDNNTISTGGGNDFVQLNHNVQGTKIDLGTGNDGIRLSNEGHVNFNTETLIDGGVDFDTLYLNGKETDYWIEDANHNKITYSQYVQENKDINGYSNKLFYIYEVDGNGTKQGSGFKIKNVEDIVFEKDAPKEVIIKAVEYKVDISASLTDTDRSETLSVVIKNVPTGAVLESTKYDVSKNSDGSWSVNFKEGTTGDALLKIEDSLTMKVPQSSKGDINLEIVGRSTENDYTKPENEGGKNYAESKATDGIKTVYVKLEGDATTKEGGDLVHNLKLVDAEGKIVNIKSGEEITVNLKYTSEQGTVDSKDFSNGNYGDTTITLTSSTPRDANGNYIIKNTTEADGISEGTEKYSLEITGVSQKNNTFDDIRIDLTENKVTATIEEGLFFKGADHNVTLYNEQVIVKDGSDSKVTTNLVLTLDVSYSMVQNNAGVNRLVLAKDALTKLINEYSEDGTAMVNLTLFAHESKNIGWMKAEDAIKYINSLNIPSASSVTSGYKVTLDKDGNVTLKSEKTTITGLSPAGTNYEDAIGKTTAISFEGKEADRTLAFFISDGEPTAENNSKGEVMRGYNDSNYYASLEGTKKDNSNDFTKHANGTELKIDGQTYGRVDKEYYDKWSGFVNSNTIGVTTVIGLGKLSKEGQAYLNMMAGAYNGEAIFVGDKDVTELMSALAKDGSASGTIFSEVENKSGNLSIESIKFDGISYTKSQYNSAKNSEGLTSTDGKYKLSMNFETGEYKFTALVKEFKGNDNPSFDVTVKDSATNETATGTVNFNVVSSDGEYNLGYSEIDGGAGYDVIKLTLGQDIDFSELGTVIKNIEQIDLSEKGENKLLNLSLKDVLNMTDKDNTLRITGTSEDKVTFKDNDGWVKANSTVTEKIGEDTKTFEIYTNSGDPTVQVKVEEKISDGITN
ncbi:hypothetical protein CJ672_00205 [Arcobacter cryaerophilus gv. occultus]|nr:hypothetical protein CJ672_00205 [Arcobacter cryaerophilus gv. occultus]